MNKKLVIIIIVIALLVIAAVAYVVITPKKEDISRVDTQQTSLVDEASRSSTPKEGETTPALATNASNARDGSYVNYTNSVIASTPGTKVLFFHAPWCSQCRQMETSINQGGIPNGVTVIKVDYDTNQALRQKYGVTLQTTFVKINDSGDKTASYVAFEDPTFSNVERALLQ